VEDDFDQAAVDWDGEIETDSVRDVVVNFVATL
jgi:hypothetical protein